MWRRHVDHLRKREVSALEDERDPRGKKSDEDGPQTAEEAVPEEQAANSEQRDHHQQTTPESHDQDVLPTETRRISTRIRNPPVRFRDEYGYN